VDELLDFELLAHDVPSI